MRARSSSGSWLSLWGGTGFGDIRITKARPLRGQPLTDVDGALLECEQYGTVPALAPEYLLVRRAAPIEVSACTSIVHSIALSPMVYSSIAHNN
jgi:hypothetical protein